MNKLWIIIEETDDYILCHGVYSDSYTALGHLIALASDSNDEWKENGYEMTKREEFYNLECGGWGWSYEFTLPMDGRIIKETWHLLSVTEGDIEPLKVGRKLNEGG